MYSDNDIKKAIIEGKIIIQNYSEDCIRSSSYLLRLNEIVLEKINTSSLIDTKSTDLSELFEKKIISEEGFVIEPNKLYLFSSFEKVSLSKDIAGLMTQLSSMARIGLSVNFSSILVSSTFGNNNPSSLTFEVINLSNNPIKVYPYVKFVHLCLFNHSTPSSYIYNGIYGNSDIPKASNFNKKPSK